MTFTQWVDQQRGEYSVNSVLEPLAAKLSGRVSKTTLFNLYNGMRLKFYDKADAVSKATGGRVKITEVVQVH